MEFLIAIVIGIAWGWWAREHAAKRQVDNMFKKIEELQGEVEEDEIIARVEKHGDTFYLFNEKDDYFLAQGKNWDEILFVLRERFRGEKKVLVRKDQAEELGLL